MEPDSYMMDYHPYRGGNNPEHSPGSDSQTLSYFKQGILHDPAKKEEFEARIGAWIRRVLSGVTAPVVIVIAPGHSQGSTGQGNLLYNILEQFTGNNIIDGRTLLVRTTTVPKSTAGGPGARDQDRHKATITVSTPDLVEGKEVFIFDDVWTSGATLRACQEVVTANEATSVKLFAVGKTV